MDGWYYFFLGVFVSSIAFLIFFDKIEKKNKGNHTKPSVAPSQRQRKKEKTKEKEEQRLDRLLEEIQNDKYA